MPAKKPTFVPPDALDNIVYGTNKGDTIHGLAGIDTVYGGNGEDSLYGDSGDDTLFGGNGKDVLHGDDGDEATLDDGNDTLNGGNAKDWLFGEGGDDVLDGGHGKDVLEGGAGDDKLYGDKGKDSFVFGPDFGNDTIFDFSNGKEKIDLSGTGLSASDFGSFVIDPDGNDATIDTGMGTIRVVDAAGLIHESDFIFAA